MWKLFQPKIVVDFQMDYHICDNVGLLGLLMSSSSKWLGDLMLVIFGAIADSNNIQPYYITAPGMLLGNRFSGMGSGGGRAKLGVGKPWKGKEKVHW